MKKIAALALMGSLLTMGLTGCSDANTSVTAQDGGNFLPETTVNPISATVVSQATPEPLFSLPTDVPAYAAAASTATPNPDMMAIVEEATPTPEPTDVPEATENPDIDEEPEQETSAPEPTSESPYAGYSYATLTDSSFGFYLDYPSNWRNLPGKYTACYEEQVSEEDFAARVAVTAKEMPHKPESETVLKQFQSYAERIYREYDPETFEFGDLSETTFMGKKAYEITYLAYSGETEVQGYMCCCAIDYTIYVYHFRSAYDDYEDMKPVLKRIRDSVKALQ